MSLYVLGISHKTAPIAIREKLSFSEDEINSATSELLNNQLADEVVIFSTCNRTEIYLITHSSEQKLTQWLSNFKQFPLEQLRQYTFHYSSTKSSRHLFRVSCGLDSLVIGEPQILGQVKAAFQYAKNKKTIKSQLSQLFQETFHVAKQVRSQTDLGKNSLSIVHAAIKLSEQFFDDYGSLTALIIGAGETGELAVKSLNKKSIGQIIIANRTLEKAQKLSNNTHGSFAISLSQINQHLDKVDIIISAVNSKKHILNHQDFNQLSLKNFSQIQLLLDLGVPRNIAPEVTKINDIYCYTIDDLSNIVSENKSLRKKEAVKAEKMVNDYSLRFDEWLNLKKNHHLIKQINHHAQTEKKALMDNALKKISNGESADIVIEEALNKLTKKLMHQPNQLIRELGEKNNRELLDLIKMIYRID